jgi:nonribosomal peptide synthetase DhbF
VPLKTSGTNPPLFCVHPGGGIATVFSLLAKYIRPGTPVWGIQAKGLENDETPHEDIGSMAEAYIQAMRTIQPQGPYQVLGWSQGGLIAQEMAVRLEHAGEKVGLVALLDTTCNIPHELDPRHTKDVDAYINELLINLCGVNVRDLVEDRSAKLDQLIAFLVANQFIPAGTSQDWVIRIIRQMMHVPHQSHQHAPVPCQAPILFFGATREAPTIPPIEHAWEGLTRKGLSFYPVDTHHMTMCSDLSSKIIANHLNGWLETNQPD